MSRQYRENASITRLYALRHALEAILARAVNEVTEPLLKLRALLGCAAKQTEFMLCAASATKSTPSKQEMDTYHQQESEQARIGTAVCTPIHLSAEFASAARSMTNLRRHLLPAGMRELLPVVHVTGPL
jgi:hypothetical protein